MALFSPKNKTPHLVVSMVGSIYALAYPFDGAWTFLSGFWSGDNSNSIVTFETAIKGAQTKSDGTLQVIDPYPMLMMQSGNSRALAWDGRRVYNLDPAKNQTPIGTWMKWIGGRLWVADGNRLRVSNILDPINFTEEDLLAEGGYFVLPDECTGLGVTADQKSLLAFTATTTTAFQAGITDRSTWGTTPDFQKVIFPNIGCIAGNTIVNQYGILWWMSQNGLTRLDNALQSYRTSKVHFLDNNMARSKGNLSSDISKACAGWFENFLMISVPSGDNYNSHTWIMDQSTLDLLGQDSTPAWAGVWTGTRPTQWVTGNVNGQSRCFFCSADKPFAVSGNRFEGNVWEAFNSTGKDIGANQSGTSTPKNISSSVELRYLGDGDTFKAFSYAVLELSEVSDGVHLDVFYASRHSGYKQVLSKDIVATRNSLTVGVPITSVDSYIKQRRIVRTFTDDSEKTDLDPQVESKMPRNIDKMFSLLIKWSGSMTISKVKLCTTPGGDHVETEEDEATQRYVKPDGSGAILNSSPIPISIVSGKTSSNLMPVSPRWEEDNYSSLA